uniref:EF-hand domain-containing protein n=1 Tax=Plectus sambesii TaxID=2011161 RepID=A0A914WB84_9BILA
MVNAIATALLLVVGSFYALAIGIEPAVKILPDGLTDFVYQEETHDEEFKRADANGDGKLDKCEFPNRNKWAAQSNEEQFKEFDMNADGFVSKDEQDAYFKKQEEEALRWKMEYYNNTLQEFDTNGDQLLQQDELAKLMRTRYSSEPNADFPFAKFDLNADKGIDAEELEKFESNIPWDNVTPIEAAVEPAVIF